MFQGLRDLNDGLDAGGMRYFAATDFEVVLNRVREMGLGVFGIEPWKVASILVLRPLRTTRPILLTQPGTWKR